MILGADFAFSVADYNSGSYLEMPVFESEILDLISRDVTIYNRIKPIEATGHPHRYLKQGKIARNAKFGNPRALAATQTDTDRQRTENAAFLKCVESRITYSLFDKELVRQQGTFANLLSKDMVDATVDFLQFQNQKMWIGNDTSLDAPTTTEYMGLLKQITKTGTVATGKLISDVIRTECAKIAKDSVAVGGGKPTAIYMNPVTIDIMEQEEIARDGNYRPLTVELIPGITVTAIRTQIGVLPIIPDAFLPVAVDNEETPTKDIHKIVLVNENLIERPYLTSSAPRIFKLGLTESLIDDYVMVQFDTITVKAPDTAHMIITKEVAIA